MKRSRNIRKQLIPVCMVLAFALLLGLTLNLYKPIKRLTQKKVVNPENLLQSEDIKWCPYLTKDGITYELNKDGSWHIYGTSTRDTNVQLMLNTLPLEAGKTYMLSSGADHCSVRSFCLAVKTSDALYVGDMKPESGVVESIRYGSFVADGGACYLKFYVWNAGAVIDETIYPCLVEGTEPGDFYIYK